MTYPTLWLTGLSGSGKSTLALALSVQLHRRGIRNQVIDGDWLRQSQPSLGFTRADRRANVLRAAGLCRACNAHHKVAIAALISPYQDDREAARALVGPKAFTEIHLSTPLAVCEQRDPKGLYQRARAGAIAHFTGITDPYEVPTAPALRLSRPWPPPPCRWSKASC